MEQRGQKESGDGHEPDVAFKGPIIDVNDLKREDGLLTRSAPSYQSLLRYILTAHSNKDYRQELKMALFASPDEADEAVSALNECFVLGMDPTPIIDQITARSAGKNHEFVYENLRTLTHTTFTTNYQKGNKNVNPRYPSSPLG